MRAPGLHLLALAVTALAASGCGGGEPAHDSATTAATTAGEAPETITVLGSRQNTGPFGRSLSLKLVDGPQPIQFYVCAAWAAEKAPADCTAARDARLPAGTILRLEERPAGPAVTSRDSPGWGTVGTSDSAQLSVPLSNGVTGNRLGKVTFRATLRNRSSGHVRATSNPFTLTWHE